MVTNYSSRNTKDTEKVDLVDKTGKVTGQATRDQVYKKGLLHPAVNILVANSKGQIFIQRRGSKRILPWYWDISAAEHVRSGENYRSAAIRGLKEELSITASVKLLRKKHIQKNVYKTKDINLIEFELVQTYGAIYNGKIRINHEEIAEGRFVSFEKLNELIENPKIKFSPWGLDELNYLFNNPSIISELIR